MLQPGNAPAPVDNEAELRGFRSQSIDVPGFGSDFGFGCGSFLDHCFGYCRLVLCEARFSARDKSKCMFDRRLVFFARRQLSRAVSVWLDRRQSARSASTP